MAVDLTPNTITSGYNLSKLNQNFTNIDVALQDAVSRSGQTPNTMTADFDMNSNDLLNVGDITFAGSSGFVKLTGAQTVTDKTFTAPIINGVVGGTATSQTITALTATSINGVTAPTAQYTTSEESKLSGVEAGADVTDSANVIPALVGQAVVANSMALSTGVTVTGFDISQSLGTSDTLAVTQNAVKVYVDNATAASAVWSDVVYLDSSDSPYTIAANGTLYAVDTSGGAVTVNLPAIGAVGDGYAVAVKKTTGDTNSITVVPNGSEEIDQNAGNILIGTENSGRQFLSDTDATPDSWTTMQFGATGGNMTVQNYEDSTDYTSGTTTTLTVSSSPASEDNMVITFDGVTQHHDTYSLSGVTVTFSSAIPTGTADVEIRWGGTLSINTPADNTVNTAQLAAGPVKDINQLAVTDGGVIVGDGVNFVLESGATARASLGVMEQSTSAENVTGTADNKVASVLGTNEIASIARQNAQNGAYTTVAADAGKHVMHASGSTDAYLIAANASVAYPVGTMITFVNLDADTITLDTDSTDTLVLAGVGDTAPYDIVQYGLVTALKTTSTSWIVSGPGIT